jgi:hypothetical protein
MLENEKIVTAFQLFNEKVDKLSRLSFSKPTELAWGFTLTWKANESGDSEEMHERYGPQEESIDAFVNTFRFFIQNNEISSLENMARHYQVAPIDESLKQDFVAIRNQINVFLDSQTTGNESRISFNNELLTNRTIMETFVYGGLSHSTKKKRYDSWMKIPAIAAAATHRFVIILEKVRNNLLQIKTLNEKALAQMEDSG